MRVVFQSGSEETRRAEAQDSYMAKKSNLECFYSLKKCPPSTTKSTTVVSIYFASCNCTDSKVTITGMFPKINPNYKV